MLPALKKNEALPYALERSEAVYWGKYYDDPHSLKPMKMELNGAVACALPGVDILAMNRVIGWGWTGSETATEITRLIEFYNTCECPRFFLQLSPYVPRREHLNLLLEAYGFRRYNCWSKLWRPISLYNPKVNTFFEIKTIGRGQAEEYGQVLYDSFDWQDLRLISFLAATVGKSDYRHYLVYDDHRAVAAGALHFYQEYASMAFAATLPAYRGMGAQSLLIHQRIADAAKAGARYLIAETAIDRPTAPSNSFRNLQRFGFEPAYERENWIFEREV
jgi:ribosomal protein S18 acetylase RimI-like enzyme